MSDADGEALAIDSANALTIENEDESKSTSRFNNPINRRHHLVLLPKNSQGLQELFHLTSRSFLEGFYRFPRVDIRMLKETLTRGNVVASSACIAGFPSWSIFRELQAKKFDELLPALLDDPATLDRCVAAVGNVYDMMSGVFGKDYHLELQFNRLGAQDVTNRAIIEFAQRNGLTEQLVVTCDSHYYNPDVWREREIYKKLGYLSYTAYSPDTLPKTKDDLKAELYPKNATQVWDEYLRSKERCPFYDGLDDVVRDAVERTHDIAHHVIGEVKPDRSIKLPKKLVPTDRTPIEHLTLLCIDGMKKRGLKGKKEYVERLKYELDIIDKMQMSEYFITLARILDLAREVVTIGPARGSGGGSLVNYVLYIIDLDPIRWKLPFERFMSLTRIGIPDIDCVHESHLVVMADRTHKRAGDIVTGDVVLGGDGVPHSVLATYSRKLRHSECAVWVRVRAADNTLGHILVVPGHKFVKTDGEVIRCSDLRVGDALMATCEVTVVDVDHDGGSSSVAQYVDLTVEGDHRFHVVPFDVTIKGDVVEHAVGYGIQHL